MEWLSIIKDSDPELYGYMKDELERQRTSLEMIPSENFTSEAVLQAMGSILTNKYSEGYPGKRYYGGNEFIDKIERLAIARAREVFGVVHVNVQPYSGSPANLAVYLAVCKPGETIMGQALYDGGHLTHGSPASATGQIFRSVQYHVKADGLIDIEEVRRLAQENKPKLIWVGFTAYSRPLPFKEFAEIADSVGAYLAADISHISGLVVGGAHESPAKYVHIITTTTHKTLRGPRGAMIMVTQKGVQKDPELPSKIDKSIFPGLQGGPHDHQTAGIAIALMEAAKPEFREYARQIVANAKALADGLMKNDLKVVTDGTDNHLILVDLSGIAPGMGVFAQDALDEAGITMNKNTVPGERSSPFHPSGLRMGTPALTTRGMKEKEMALIAEFISQAIEQIKEERLPTDKETRIAYMKEFRKRVESNSKLKEIRKDVAELCGQFPLYPEMQML